MLGGSPSRNAVSHDDRIPVTWDVRTRRNILWSARLGKETYGSPVVAGGMVFVGTGNEVPRSRRVPGKRGVLMAFRAADGKFLWQDAAPNARRGLENFLIPCTTSSPLVEGERLYYMTAQCQLRSLDTHGFADGENDGPLRDESRTGARDADLIWELDVSPLLGVFPHEAPNCSVVAAGDLLMVCTSNGVDEAHTNIPAPRAPSFIGVNKWTGDVVWRVAGPSERVLHGQWSSPSVAEVHGRTLAFFGGGDGWLYALEASTGREVWRYDGNPEDAVWRTGGDIAGAVLRNNIIACPLVHEGRVYLAMGQDPLHGEGRGRLHAIDATGQGDVTGRRRIWVNEDIGRTLCTPVAHEDLLFVGDYNGLLHAIDLASGRTVWTHDLLAAVWGALAVIDGKLYVGDEDGTVTVLRAARTREIIARIDMGAPLWSAPAIAGGVLYIATSGELFAIARKD
jgi:outer membrane protein assembly factor BamB